EEIGSPSLKTFLERHARTLQADAAVMSDTLILGPDRPALTYSLRGGLSLELEVSGPRQDLHSGTYGGAVHNPLQALCEMVASLHDPNGRIAVPGFYDRVRRHGPTERAYMARVGPSDTMILARATAKLNFRLVPDQDPREIDLLVRRHIARVTPPTVKTRVTTQLRARPAVIDRRHPVMQAASRAYR